MDLSLLTKYWYPKFGTYPVHRARVSVTGESAVALQLELAAELRWSPGNNGQRAGKRSRDSQGRRGEKERVRAGRMGLQGTHD